MKMTKTKKKSAKPTKPYWEMTLDELRDATKEFDGPINESEWRPMTKAERAEFERMQKKPARSIFIRRPDAPKGNGVPIQRLLEGIDPQIISRVEKYAVEHEMSPLDFIAKSLESSLHVVGG